MQKIASPQHLAIQLRRLLAYAQGPNPSRAIIARELRIVARQVSVIDMEWREFQGEYLNPVGMLLHKGKKWSWEEVKLKDMSEALKMASSAAGDMSEGHPMGQHFKSMASRLGQARSMLNKGLGGATVADSLSGWKLEQFEQLVTDGLKVGAKLRRQLDG